MKKAKPAIGGVMWMDLTIPDARKVCNFYAAVTGWQPEAVPMDGYEDYVMKSPTTGASIAGICHTRGENKHQPPQWLIYITVADLTKSLRAVRKLGGKVVAKPRGGGEMGRFAVIQDPAGAVATLFQPAG